MAIIKFAMNEPVEVVLDFDTGKQVDGDYGTQFQYGCNDGNDIFYATPTLATLIDQITEGKGKGKKVMIMKKTKTGPDGKDIPIFTVNNMSMDDISQVKPIATSPVGAGFAHKDTKARSELTMSDLDYRLQMIEQRLEKLDGAKVVHTEEELPF